VVPVLCGSFAPFVQGDGAPTADPGIEAFVATLRRWVRERPTLVVAAGDLGHIGPAFDGPPVTSLGAAQLRAADETLIDHMCVGDATGLFAAIEAQNNRHNVCGLPPIYLALRVLDPVEGERVAYDQCSADPHDTSWVSICGVTWH
jgi:hypothetical protein